MGKILRRTFLIGSAAIVGGVAIGYWQISKPYKNPLLDSLKEDEAALTPFVLLNTDGVSIIVPRAEMGQGVMTTLAALVAEELDVSLDEVTVLHGPAGKAYYNAVLLEDAANVPATDASSGAERLRNLTHIPAKLMGMQITGGSTSTPDAFNRMRKAGAAARAVLIKAAAKKLGVNPASLNTHQGAVITSDGTRLGYGELAMLARDIDPPSDPALKPKEQWTLLGKSQPRVDMIGKCTGTAQYAMDVRLPGMLYATARMNPNRDAPMEKFDASRAETMPGVRKIMALENGIAVIATNSWNAMRAAKAVNITWGAASYVASTQDHYADLEKAFSKEFRDSKLRKDGKIDTAFANVDSETDTLVEATYRVPYLAHATMEPMNAVAYLHDGQLEIWAGNQAPTQALKDAAAISGLPQDKIKIHTPLMGGGFGRRAEMDFIKQAITLAISMKGTPIKLIWSREEDITQDYYRPAAMAKFKARINGAKPTAIDLHVAATSVADSQFGRLGINLPGPDPTIPQNAWDQPYALPAYHVTGYKAPMMLPVSSWRSVGASQNGFFHECMMDEIAHAAGRDPIEMRLALMDHTPSKKVLERVRDMSGWGGSLPSNRTRGAAFFLSFGVPCAQVIEIEQTARGIKLKTVWAAVDVGTALDPANITAQVQSAIIYGLSAALNGEITVLEGKVQQSNFHDYDALRMFQCPHIEVSILENGHTITGIGEPGLPPIAPALTNAVFALTGERYRTLPLTHHVKFV